MADEFQAFDYRCKFGSKNFPFPIFTASGCASSGKEPAQFYAHCHQGADESSLLLQCVEHYSVIHFLR